MGEVHDLLSAADYAQLERAAFQIDQVRSEFEDRGRFASDAPAKLSLVEHGVGQLREKHRLLMTRAVQSEDRTRSAVSNLTVFFLASLCELQVDLLGLYLALQNDPDVVEGRQLKLRQKIERYDKDFRQALDDDRVGAFHRKLKRGLAKPFLPSWLASILRGRTGEQAKTERNVPG